MDPNVMLARMRQLALLLNESPGNQIETDSDHGMALAELVSDLDQWLSKGGVPPIDWYQHG